VTHPYAEPGYVAALAQPGEQAMTVSAWRTAVLIRPIPGAGLDGAGAYPMAALDPESDIQAGLDQLSQAGLTSFVMVADPLQGPPAQKLASAFDIARPFKTHYVVEPQSYAPSKHHRAEIRRSLRRCRVERARLADMIEVWTGLYAHLSARHEIGGVADFSEEYWRLLANLRGLEAFVARVEGEAVTMSLWLEHQGVAYNHLGASAPEGYAAGAGYALYDAAIQHYHDRSVLNLGGGAGLQDDATDGLARFKCGFSTGAVQAHLYGKVLDRSRYDTLSEGRSTSFFPSYRG
jgi:hypothetical protein